jgi:hypothetical protein
MAADNTDTVLFDVTREQLAAAFRLMRQITAVITVARWTPAQREAVEAQTNGLDDLVDALRESLAVQRVRQGEPR